MKLQTSLFGALLIATAPAFATTPASGELTETTPQSFTGGPYVLPTPGGIVAGSGVECEVPQTCDEYALTVTISDEFRADEKNKKEVAQIIMTGSNPTPAAPNADIDLYLLDAGGNEVASSTGGTYDEAISVPLTVLKNGAYTVRLITGIPLGSTESVEIRVGRGKKSNGMTVTPAVAAIGETVSFDARSLGAGNYVMNFGDGESTTSADGFSQHAYDQNGVYQARLSDASGKSLAMQPVVIASDLSAKSSSLLAGGFGVGGLLGLLAAGLARRRILLAALLGLVSAGAQADGSGTINDATLTASYAGGGPTILPNPFVLADNAAPPPTCMEGTPTCETYTLTVDFSETFRADPANDRLQVSFTLGFEGDWDMWMLDGSDAVIGSAAGTENPEKITTSLKQLPNGVYKFQMTPFFPETTGFEFTADASGSKSADAAKSSSLVAGGLGSGGLIGLLGFAAMRRRLSSKK